MSNSVITSSVVFQSNRSNTMPSSVFDQIQSGDEVQIMKDSSPNRISNPDVNKDLTPY